MLSAALPPELGKDCVASGSLDGTVRTGGYAGIFPKLFVTLPPPLSGSSRCVSDPNWRRSCHAELPSKLEAVG